jgi:hypothetical protein
VLFQCVKNIVKKGSYQADKAILNIPLIGRVVRKIGKRLLPEAVRKMRSEIIGNRYWEDTGINQDLFVSETGSAKRYWQDILDEAMLQGADVENRH